MSCYAVMNAMLRPGLSPSESRLYAYLVFRANGARVCWPSVPEMMLHLDASRRTILSGTKRLKTEGLIRIRKRWGDRNQYLIVDVEGMEQRPHFPSVHDVAFAAWDGGDDDLGDLGEGGAEFDTTRGANFDTGGGAETDTTHDALEVAEGCENWHWGGANSGTTEVQKLAQESSNKNLTITNKEEDPPFPPSTVADTPAPAPAAIEPTAVDPPQPAAPELVLLPGGSEGKRPRRLKPTDDPSFDAFYALYPRPIAKDAAHRAWKAWMRKGASPEAIMAGLQHRIAHDWRGRPPDRIPHPATFLNGPQWVIEAVQAVPDKPAGDPSDIWGFEAWLTAQPDVTVEPWRDDGSTCRTIGGWNAQVWCDLAGYAASLTEDWRGSWDAMGAWMRADIGPEPHILRAIEEKADWMLKAGRPIRSMELFDAEVRAAARRKVAA